MADISQQQNVAELTSSGDVTALGAHSDMTGVDGTGSNAAPLADVNTDIEAIHTQMDLISVQQAAIRTKLDAVIAMLGTSGLMSRD